MTKWTTHLAQIGIWLYLKKLRNIIFIIPRLLLLIGLYASLLNDNYASSFATQYYKENIQLLKAISVLNILTLLVMLFPFYQLFCQALRLRISTPVNIFKTPK